MFSSEDSFFAACCSFVLVSFLLFLFLFFVSFSCVGLRKGLTLAWESFLKDGYPSSFSFFPWPRAFEPGPRVERMLIIHVFVNWSRSMGEECPFFGWERYIRTSWEDYNRSNPNEAASIVDVVNRFVAYFERDAVWIANTVCCQSFVIPSPSSLPSSASP